MSGPKKTDRAKELEDALFDLTENVWLVLDCDWWMTKTSIPDIADDATFLRPNVEDEHNNWANRGMMLESYRRARALLVSRGRDPEPSPLVEPTRPELVKD